MKFQTAIVCLMKLVNGPSIFLDKLNLFGINHKKDRFLLLLITMLLFEVLLLVKNVNLIYQNVTALCC